MPQPDGNSYHNGKVAPAVAPVDNRRVIYTYRVVDVARLSVNQPFLNYE